MTPDWKDAPEWAKWKAMDENGMEWYYEEKPIENRLAEWIPVPRTGKASPILHPYWRDTLEARPK